MVDGLGRLVGAVAAGAVDASGISTNAAYDVLKGISQKTLARVMEPAVRDKILGQTVTNLEADGMGAEQAAYLAGVVRDKRHLERGAKDDPMALIRLVQTEVLAAGHSEEESSALLTALARAVAQHTSAEPGGAIAGVQTLLNTEQLLSESAQIQQALSQVTQALQQSAKTPRQHMNDVAARLWRAGHTEARLELTADGRVNILGGVSLTVRATGETAKALEGAVKSVEGGEEGIVRRLGDDQLIITTGDAEIDGLLNMGANATQLILTPTLMELPIVIRARGEPDIKMTATIRALGNPAGSEGVQFVLADRAHLTLTLTIRPTTIDWHWRMSLDNGPLTEADRPILQAMVALAKPKTRLYHGESGAKLLTFPDAGEELVEVADNAQFWLDILDLWAHLREELPEVTFTPDVPDPERLDTPARNLLIDILRFVTGQLEGTSATATASLPLTRHNIQLLSKGEAINARVTREVQLPGWSPLRLTLILIGERPECWVNGQRINRKKLWPHQGKQVELRINGKVKTPELTAGGGEEDEMVGS